MDVLIVDDSKAMRIIIARALKEMGVPGFPYLEAANGRAALTAVADKRPALVISDFNMPEMSGMELLKSMRDGGVATPFGFITSESSSQLHQEAVAAGASFLVSKPFTAANLSHTIGPILEKLGCATDDVDGRAVPDALDWKGKFPPPAQIGSTLKELLRRNIQATLRQGTTTVGPGVRFVAEYSQAEGHGSSGYCVCDIAFAARTGAALTVIPSGAAEEAIRAGVVTDTLNENFHEVLNVMARFFSLGGSTRANLGAVHLPGEVLNSTVVAHLAKPAARLDLTVDVTGYGTGLLTLVLVA